MYGVTRRGELDKITEDEFEKLVAWLRAYLSVSHDEAGAILTSALPFPLTRDQQHADTVYVDSSLNASNLLSGTVDDARLSSNVPLKDGDETISGEWAFTPGIEERGYTAKMGDWESYTPAWTAATVNPSLGDGTLTGKYIRLGKTVFFKVRLVMGSTTTYGTGAWRLSLPFNASDNTEFITFLGGARDNNVTQHYAMQGGSVGASVNTFVPRNAAAGTGDTTATNPFTWANGDTLSFAGFYEVP